MKTVLSSNKKLFYCLLLICCVVQTTAQNEIHTLVNNSASGKSIFTEKVFVHTDKTFYLAGEVMWFKIYCTDGSLHTLSDASRVAYIELLTNDHKPVLQAKISLESGTGNGYFTLPTSILSGAYRIRAYTNWMKNFGAESFYNSPITIVNTFKAAAYFPTNSNKVGEFLFFPEGGDLVYGLTSRIGIKLVNQSGEGMFCKGIVLDEKNDTISKFETTHAGMGSFTFKPERPHNYHALLNFNDSTITKELPEILDKGFVMTITDHDAGNLTVTVQASEDYNNLSLHLLRSADQILNDKTTSQIIHGKATFNIEKLGLPDGISQFTLLNSQYLPLCERLYFKCPANYLHTDIKSKALVYGVRKKIDLDLETTFNSVPVKTNLSLSVFMVDSLQDIPTESILTYMLLTSYLKGKIESPDYYFNPELPGVKEATNNLLITQGWRRFTSQTKNDHLQQKFTYLPELEGNIISGKVIDKRSGLPADSVTGYISSPGRQFEMNSAVSGVEGNINFYLKNLYGNNEFIFQTNYLSAQNNYRIDLQNPFSEDFTVTNEKYFTLSKNLENTLTIRHVSTQIENSYSAKNRHIFKTVPQYNLIPFYGKPDKNYLLDDYTRFVTMEEVMREYVVNVRIRKESDKFHFKVINALFNTYFKDDPLILIDGVPVIDADKIMALDPLRIKSIGVISHRYYLGPLTLDGIVSFRTYEGDLAGYQLDSNAVVVAYEGLQQSREFYSPKYDASNTSASSRIPDFRNVLLWEPDIDTPDNGKKHLSFYTSDLTGNFAILIEGISKDGMLTKSIMKFSVAK